MYGGTQSEMARLVNESGVLGDSFEATAENVKDIPFHTLIEAIHVTQEEMGVTGTTAQEAEETVSGSFGMMKASLSDLAAGFGQEGSNMTGLIGNFQTSIEVFADNIKRVLGNMWDNLPLKPWQKYMGAILVATGPVLTGLGKVGNVIAGSFDGLGSIATNIGKFSGATKAAGGITQVFSGEMTQLGEAFPGFAKGIGALKKGFGALTSPAGLAIGAIVALGAGFVIAYKKSETFRNFIAKIGDMLSNAWQSIVNFKDQVVTAFDAVFSIFKGDKVGGAELLQSIGLSDETIQTIVVYVSVIRRKFFELKDRVTEALSIVGDFFKGIFESIGEWWNNNGETILGYVVTGFEWLKETIGLTMELIGAIWDRTWSIIQGVIEVVWPIVSGIISGGIQKIVDLFNFFAPIVSGIWNTLWPILQVTVAIVWERIKLVIGTAMDIIQGVIKVATALINGDWSAAWNAVKETIANVKDRVVEYISNMKDIAVNLIKALVDNVVSWFTNLWTKITNRVNQIRDVASTVFAHIKQLVVSRVKEMVNSVVRWFLNLFNNIRDRVNSIKTTVVRIFTDTKNNVLNRVKGLYNSVTDRFRDTYNSVKKWMTNAKNAAVDLAVGMKNRVIDKAKEILNYFKKLPRRLGDAIRNGKNAFKAGFAKMLNAGISSVESGVNKIIGGVNWVLDKLGASKISTWSASRVSVPAYAKGTDGHPEDGPAIVGDGGMKELIAYPDGSFGMSPNTPTLTNMPKGTQVLSGSNTKSLMNSMGVPQYKSGIGKAWDSVKNVTSSFWSWATDGAKNLLNKALGFLGVSAPSSSDGPGIFGNVAKGAFTTIKDAALDRIDKLIDDLFSAPAGGAGGGVNRWRGVATQALMMTGQFTPSNLNSLLFQMSTESGGNPSAINNWDINAKRGTPSKGLMQVIDPTFQAYKMPGFNNIWNPLDNILASIRYALSRYGTLSRAYRGVGYADGGIVSKPGMYALAENGWPEFVIPTEPSKRGDAMKLLALAAKRLQKGNTQVNYSGGSSNGAALAPDMTETNNLLKTLIEMIAQGQVLKADDKALAEVVYGHIDETMNKNYSRKNIMRIKREE